MKELLKMYQIKLKTMQDFLYNGNDTPLVRLEVALLTQMIIDINKQNI
jgi:hypothetical protein